MVIWVIKIFFYSSSVYSCHIFLISSASVRSIPFLSYVVPIFAWNVPLASLISLKRSLDFYILLISSISLHWSLRKAFFLLFLSLLFFGSLHSDGYIFPAFLYLSLLFFSQLLEALELSQQCKDFFGIILLQFFGCLLSLWWGSHTGPPRSAETSAPVPVSGHCWPMPPQEILRHSKAGLAQFLVDPWVLVCTEFFLTPLSNSKCDFAPPTILLGLLLCTWTWGIFFWWGPTFSCLWLFSC